MAKKVTKKATKKTILMLSPQTHLKIKCYAAACKLTMGQLLTKLVDKFEDKTYSTEEYINFLSDNITRLQKYEPGCRRTAAHRPEDMTVVLGMITNKGGRRASNSRMFGMIGGFSDIWNPVSGIHGIILGCSPELYDEIRELTKVIQHGDEESVRNHYIALENAPEKYGSDPFTGTRKEYTEFLKSTPDKSAVKPTKAEPKPKKVDKPKPKKVDKPKPKPKPPEIPKAKSGEYAEVNGKLLTAKQLTKLRKDGKINVWRNNEEWVIEVSDIKYK